MATVSNSSLMSLVATLCTKPMGSVEVRYIEQQEQLTVMAYFEIDPEQDP
jgi:hypothetical protein